MEERKKCPFSYFHSISPVITSAPQLGSRSQWQVKGSLMTIYTPNISVPLYHCARVSTFKHFVDKFKNTWFSKLTEKWKRLNQWLNISIIFITLYSYKHFLPVMRTLFINLWSPDISQQWSHNNIRIINCPWGYSLFIKRRLLNQKLQVIFFCFVHTEERRFCIALKIQWSLDNNNLRNRPYRVKIVLTHTILSHLQYQEEIIILSMVTYILQNAMSKEFFVERNVVKLCA